jgi:chromosome partitioning protein
MRIYRFLSIVIYGIRPLHKSLFCCITLSAKRKIKALLPCRREAMMIIGVVSQKGGVGKSTIARMIAREYANAQWQVLVADLDTSQGTSYSWQSRRLQEGVAPEISVQQFNRVDKALRLGESYDLIVFDGAPHATKATEDIVRSAALAVLPTGLALDDLEPTVRLAHELVKQGISAEKIAVAFCRVGDSESEFEEASRYIEQAGYHRLEGSLPERTAYRRASDLGRAATETAFPSLNQRALELTQSIIARVAVLDKQEAAA